MSKCSILRIDQILSSISKQSQSGIWCIGNEELFCILPSSNLTGASESHGLISYQGHSLSMCIGAFCFPSRLNHMCACMYLLVCLYGLYDISTFVGNGKSVFIPLNSSISINSV